MNAAINFRVMEKLNKALRALEEAIIAPKDRNRFVIDSTITRFQLVFELCWKTLRRLGEIAGKESLPSSPRPVLQNAYNFGWIEKEGLWMSMLEDRNLIAHVYDETEADAVYERIKTYYPEMQRVYEKLQVIAREKGLI